MRLVWSIGCRCGHHRLHDLRHGHATMLLQMGVPLYVVSGRMSHDAETTTARIYAHFVERTDRTAADLIGAIVHQLPVGGSVTTGGAVGHGCFGGPGRCERVGGHSQPAG